MSWTYCSGERDAQTWSAAAVPAATQVQSCSRRGVAVVTALHVQSRSVAELQTRWGVAVGRIQSRAAIPEQVADDVWRIARRRVMDILQRRT